MKKSQIIIGSILFLLLLAGLGAAIVLSGRKQLIIPRAATSTGTAVARLDTESKTVTASGSSFPVNILFTTGGNPVSAVTIELDYSYTGAEPPFTAPTIVPNSALTATGEWSFPIKSFTASGGNATVKIAAINTSTTGFSASTETPLAAVTFIASSTPGTITVTFNPTQSKITRKDTGADNLLIPTSSGTYVFQGSGNPTATSAPVATPTPDTTGGGGNPTSTPIPTPTTVVGGGGGGGANPTAVPTQRLSSPTPLPTLPVSGGMSDTIGVAIGGIGLLIVGVLFML